MKNNPYFGHFLLALIITSGFSKRPSTAGNSFNEKSVFESPSLVHCLQVCETRIKHSYCAAGYMEGPLCHCGDNTAPFALKSLSSTIMAKKSCNQKPISGTCNNSSPVILLKNHVPPPKNIIVFFFLPASHFKPETYWRSESCTQWTTHHRNQPRPSH